MRGGQWIDCGIFLDQLMLLAREKGLHTCPAAFSHLPARGAPSSPFPMTRS